MAQRPSIGDYVETIKQSAPRMVSDISELAKAELKPIAKHGGIGAGMFGAAAVLGGALLWILLLVAGFAFAILFNQLAGMSAVTSLCLGFLCVAGLVLILVAVLGLIGYLNIRKVRAPEMTIAETKASVQAISEAVNDGIRDAKAGHPGVNLKAGQFPAESGVVAVAPRPDVTTENLNDQPVARRVAVSADADELARYDWGKSEDANTRGASRVEWK